MAGYVEWLSVDDLSKFYKDLSKLPKEKLKEAFPGGLYVFNNYEYDSDEHQYMLSELEECFSSESQLLEFIKDTRSRGYTFKLNGVTEDDDNAILQSIYRECEGLTLHFSGKGNPFVSYNGECAEIVLDLSNNVFNVSHCSDESILETLVYEGTFELYKNKIPKDESGIADLLHRYALGSDEYISIELSNIVLFDPEVCYDIITCDNSNEDSYNNATLVIKDIFSIYGDIDIKDLTKVLVKCCPCILNDYIWSTPKDIVPLLSDTIINECYDGIFCIYQDGNKPNTEALTKHARSCREVDMFDSIAFADKVVFHLLEMFPHPIKEAYILYNGEVLFGKYICRKCKDGEYIVTIY